MNNDARSHYVIWSRFDEMVNEMSDEDFVKCNYHYFHDQMTRDVYKSTYV